jgi:hypothetical protein
MAIVNATDNPPFATAVRGYDRAAVDEVIARESSRMRELQARAERLEKELTTPPTSGGTPAPRVKVQEALDIMGTGWDEAILITAAAEHAAALDRSHAESQAAAALAAVEERCAQDEREAEDAAKRMVAQAREAAGHLLERAAAEHDRAVEAAADMARAAQERAQQLAVQCAAELCAAEEKQAEDITARHADADRDVAAAQAELALAERQAEEIAKRAVAAREEILAQARAAADEVLVAAGAEVRRKRAENEAALAELGRLLIATGDRLVGAPAGEPTDRQLQMTRSVAS